MAPCDLSCDHFEIGAIFLVFTETWLGSAAMGAGLGRLEVSALQPYFPRNPKALVSRKLPAEPTKKTRQIASWHRLWLELGRYLIAFEPLTFVLD